MVIKRLCGVIGGLLIALCSTVFADGIMVTPDLKHVRDAHTVLQLGKKQRLGVERLRKITLTDEQRKTFKMLSQKTPCTLPVRTSRDPGCRCGLDACAVWCRPGEVDVVICGDVSGSTFNQSMVLQPDEEWEKKESITWAEIIVDGKGEMFHKGRHISEDELKGLIAKLGKHSSDAESDPRYFSFDLPPPIDEKTDKRIQSLVNRARGYCRKSNVNFSPEDQDAPK